MSKQYVSDAVDERRVRSAYGTSLIRCAGGRLIWPGYVCIHCQSGNPREQCDAPASEDRPFVSEIWTATIKGAKAELAVKRQRIEQSLSVLQHQDSDYANDHRRLLRLYEKMAQAMEEA